MVCEADELFAAECVQYIQESYAQSGYLQEGEQDIREGLYKYIDCGGRRGRVVLDGDYLRSHIHSGTTFIVIPSTSIFRSSSLYVTMYSLSYIGNFFASLVNPCVSLT